MSYPVQRCPYCQREMPGSDIEQAIQKEKEIWRPTEFEPNSSTEIIDSGSATIYNPEIPYTFTVI